MQRLSRVPSNAMWHSVTASPMAATCPLAAPIYALAIALHLSIQCSYIATAIYQEWHHQWDTKQGVSELTMILTIKVAKKTTPPQPQLYQWFTPTQLPKLSAWNGREAANILFASVAGLIPDAPLPESWSPGRHASPT